MITKPQSSKGYLTKLHPNLNIIKEMLVKHDMDFLLCITGRERIGKSTLALQIASIFDPEFKIEQVVFDIPALYEQVYKLKPGQVIIIDEGATAFFAREAMNTDVKEGVKLLTVMGERNLLVILCVPSFFIVDKYIRDHRVAGLIKVTKRGRFKYYSKRRLKQSHYNSKVNAYAWADPSFTDTFGPMSGQLWEDYRFYKSTYLMERRTNWAEEQKSSDKWYTPQQAEGKSGLSRNTLKNRADVHKVLNAVGHWRFDKVDIDRLGNFENAKTALATRVKEKTDVVAEN